jgi:hypothetical protein
VGRPSVRDGLGHKPLTAATKLPFPDALVDIAALGGRPWSAGTLDNGGGRRSADGRVKTKW